MNKVVLIMTFLACGQQLQTVNGMFINWDEPMHLCSWNTMFNMLNQICNQTDNSKATIESIMRKYTFFIFCMATSYYN